MSKRQAAFVFVAICLIAALSDLGVAAASWALQQMGALLVLAGVGALALVLWAATISLLGLGRR